MGNTCNMTTSPGVNDTTIDNNEMEKLLKDHATVDKIVNKFVTLNRNALPFTNVIKNVSDKSCTPSLI